MPIFFCSINSILIDNSLKEVIFMFYNIQDIIQLAKENLGIRELPPPVTDDDLLQRVKRSALKDFSIIYPRIEEFNIGINDQVDPGQLYANKMQGVKYNVTVKFFGEDGTGGAGYVDPEKPGDLDGNGTADENEKGQAILGGAIKFSAEVDEWGTAVDVTITL